MSPEDLLARDDGSVSQLIRARAAAHGSRIALQCGDTSVSYAALDGFIDRIAASLQASGLKAGDVVAICASRLSIEFAATFFAATRIGVVPTPLPLTVALPDLLGMIKDSGAKFLIVDDSGESLLKNVPNLDLPRRSLEDDGRPGSFGEWIGAPGAHPAPVEVDPQAPFNIIYSSGSTGAPKGIVHSHRVRWLNIKFGRHFAYDASSITIIATPPYSNLTIGHFLYYLYGGGTAVLMPSFDARGFLELAVKVRATHTFMVNLQYKRILDLPDFDRFDLSRFRMAVFGGAVSSPEFKAALLKRWPGELVEMYAMTEGGGRTLLFMRRRPDKLHTIGQPVEGFPIRIIGEDGKEVARGEVGEMIGRSEIMMSGYLNQPDKTREVQWVDSAGRCYLRMGDLATFDEDGFVILKDRKKDMIISGGFNVYPSDIERVLHGHEAVREAAVVGIPSEKWGETPAAFVVLNPGAQLSAEEIRAWANERLGKVQRISMLEVVEELPRTGPDKIAKPKLRQRAIEVAREKLGA